ncbi:hypothetical protein Tco_1311484 [Tanacetum coccineum]
MNTIRTSLGHVSLPKLNKVNYDKWSNQMRALLGTQDVWELVTAGYEEPGAAEIGVMSANQMKAWKEKHMKDKSALYLLFQSVDESGYGKIASATTAKEVCETLEKVYKGAVRVKQMRLQTLRGELEAMKIKETEGVSDYITRLQTVVNQLKRNGESLTEVVEKILRSLTDKFENVLKKKQESFDVALQTNVTVDDVKEEKVMYVEQGRGNNFRGRGFGRVEETTNLVTKEDVKVDGIVLMAYEVDVDGTVLMANEEVVLETDTTWYLDTGVGNHMCGDKQLHEEMKEVVDGWVMVGDESNVRVKKESAWDLKYKNVNHGKEEHDYKPRTSAYCPQTTYEIGECSNTSQENHIETTRKSRENRR